MMLIVILFAFQRCPCPCLMILTEAVFGNHIYCREKRTYVCMYVPMFDNSIMASFFLASICLFPSPLLSRIDIIFPFLIPRQALFEFFWFATTYIHLSIHIYIYLLSLFSGLGLTLFLFRFVGARVV